MSNKQLVNNFLKLSKNDKIKELIDEFDILYKDITRNSLEYDKKYKLSTSLIESNALKILHHEFTFEDIVILSLVKDFTGFNEIYYKVADFINGKTVIDVIGNKDLFINFLGDINKILEDIREIKAAEPHTKRLYPQDLINLDLYKNHLRNLFNDDNYINYFLTKDVKVTQSFIIGMGRIDDNDDFRKTYIKIVNKVYENNLFIPNIVDDYIAFMIFKYCENLNNNFNVNSLSGLQHSFRRYKFSHAKALDDFEKLEGGWELFLKLLSELGKVNKNNFKTMELNYDNFVKNYDSNMPLEWNMELYPINLKEIGK